MKDSLNLPSKLDIHKILKHDMGNLPSFPKSAAKLIELSTDSTVSLTDISKIVETDPGLSIRVLEIVNSAMYGLGRKITVLSEAVIFLGLDEVKKLAIGVAVFEKMFKTGQTKKFDQLLFWRHCLSVAVLSRGIAVKTNYPYPEEAYSAGLLHDIGKIILNIQGKVNYNNFIQGLAASTELVVEKERSMMGLGHDDVGAFFSSFWKLPRKLTLAIKYHHQPFGHVNLEREEKLLISIVSLADFLCWVQGIGSFDILRPPILSPDVEKIINPADIDIVNCIHHMNSEIEGISKFYNFIFPSATELRENLLWANLKLSRVNTRYYYHQINLIQRKGISRNRYSGMDICSHLGIELGRALAKAKTIKEVMDIVMYHVGRIFQPLHWSILLKEPKTSDMVFSVVVGANKKKLQGIKLPEGEGIAGYIMKTGESLIIEDVTKDKRFSIRIDKYTGFQTRSIIGTPLKTDNKIFGVVELINRINDEAFTLQHMEILSSIAEYAAIAIERLYYQQALKTLATRDSVTGFMNRWSFEQTIGNTDEVIKRYGTIFSMLIIDIDQSFFIVETENQYDNEKILKKLAMILKKTKRRGDNIFRYGDYTFIILLPLTYLDVAETARQRILKALSITADKKDYTLLKKINILVHTISAEDSRQLKKVVAKFLSRSKKMLDGDMVPDMGDTLQPLLDKENKAKSAETKGKYASLKTVLLQGKFTHLKTGEFGHINVEKLSMLSIGFRILETTRIQVQVNDFLDINFILDNTKHDLVERRAVVREIKDNLINADFYNPPPYAQNLGFYLMS